MGDLSYDVITVFLVGILGMWKAIPVGLLLHVSPLYIFLMTALGAFTGVLILFFFGSKIRNYVQNRRLKKGKSKKEMRALKLLDNYGPIGLGFFGTLLFGPNMTMVLGMALVKKEKQFLYWTMAGTVVWSMVLTILATYSVETFNRIA